MGHLGHTLHIIICICWVLTPLITGEVKYPNVIAPHCSDKCGNVTIPYPFGIESGCYFEEHDTNSPTFKINCSHISNPPKPIVGKNLEVVEVSISEGELRSKMKVSYICYNKSGGVTYSWQNSIRLTTFTLSSTKNLLVALGCDTSAWFSGRRSGKTYSMGCMSTCMEPGDLIVGECTGTGCCQASIPEGVQGLIMNARSIQNHVLMNDFNPCSVAFPVAKDAFTFYPSFLDHDAAYYNVTKRPVVFNWAIGRKNCSEAKRDYKSFLCKQNAECYEEKYQMGYRCRCKQGFSGNPYLPQGCKDVNECKEGHTCQKPEYCMNTNGGYFCECPSGHHGSGTLADPCVSNTHPSLLPIFTSIGVGGGIIALLVFAFLLHWKHGEQKLKKMRENLFRENGGLLLHEKLSGRNVGMLKIFTTKDLEMATDNYSERNIIGRGGFGIVHKGILPNNQLVAIKRSLKVNLDQVEQFINEILVLSQINNKNVVKLIGCCLESEVPLLVYEFINNGTLYDHLHDSVRASILKWPLRLRIASDVANVLSYLHNTISTPIIHRDVKSLNVLLDANYTAKVIDFGASRLVPSDKNQFTTMVLGTRGYLDPEYMQTSELTSKSDVYSFGVVLLELLTRLNAFSIHRLEKEKCLAMHFLLRMKDDRLMDIIDKNILDTGTNETEQIQQVANLAKWCLMLKGDDRPTMKEVAIELEHIISKGAHPWSDNNLSLEEECQTLLGETLVSSYSNGGYNNSTVDSSLYDALSSLGRGR